MERGVQAKLAATRQSMSDLQLNYRNMAPEKTAAVRAAASGLRVSAPGRKACRKLHAHQLAERAANVGDLGARFRPSQAKISRVVAR
jgi:hypothetical protein